MTEVYENIQNANTKIDGGRFVCNGRSTSNSRSWKSVTCPKHVHVLGRAFWIVLKFGVKEIFLFKLKNFGRSNTTWPPCARVQPRYCTSVFGGEPVDRCFPLKSTCHFIRLVYTRPRIHTVLVREFQRSTFTFQSLLEKLYYSITFIKLFIGN